MSHALQWENASHERRTAGQRLEAGQREGHGWAEARGGFWTKGGAPLGRGSRRLLGKGRGTASGQREGHESLSIVVAGASITTSPIEDGTRFLICTRRVRPTRSSRRSSRRRNNNTSNLVVGRGRAGCSWSEWEELERGRLVGTGTCWS
ncbi:hypothetical protein ACFE04_026426 [Oxalis oulophora]